MQTGGVAQIIQIRAPQSASSGTTELRQNGGSVSAPSSLGVATTAGPVSLLRQLGDPAMRVVMAAGSAIVAA